MTTLYTLGHSNQPIESFLDLLARHRIRRIADVRRFPSSRRWPQFNQGALAASLQKAQVAYRHFEDLGGKRDATPESRCHPALESSWQRDYAAYMNTAAYARALDALEAYAGEHPTAVMCAEAKPDHCHRALLSDALLTRGNTVIHVLSQGEKPHRHPSSLRVDGNTLYYDQGVLPLFGD